MAYALLELFVLGFGVPIFVAAFLLLRYLTGRSIAWELRVSAIIFAVLATVPWIFFWGWYINAYTDASGDLNVILEQVAISWWGWYITILTFATPVTYLCVFFLIIASFFTPKK